MFKNYFVHFGLTCLLFLLVGCGIVVPPEKQDFIGRWQSDNDITLTLYAGGQVEYEDRSGSVKKSLSGPLQQLDTQLVFGLGKLSKTFVIKSAPTKKDGQWMMQLNDIVFHKTPSASELSIPDPETLKTLVHKNIEYFNQSVDKKDMTTLHEKTSKLFQSEVTPEKMNEVFGAFIAAREVYIDLVNQNNLSTENLVISKNPVMTEDGFLHLEGYYSSDPQINFDMQFTYEYPEWKLASIKVEI